jgi:hypothetical protein
MVSRGVRLGLFHGTTSLFYTVFLGKDHRELKALTVEGRATASLEQYAQHTCCFVHFNVHLFPHFIQREEEREGGGVFKKRKGRGGWRPDETAKSGSVSRATH